MKERPPWTLLTGTHATGFGSVADTRGRSKTERHPASALRLVFRNRVPGRNSSYQGAETNRWLQFSVLVLLFQFVAPRSSVRRRTLATDEQIMTDRWR